MTSPFSTRTRPGVQGGSHEAPHPPFCHDWPCCGRDGYSRLSNSGAAIAAEKDDPLLPLVRRFQDAEAALNATGPLSDEECNARTDANNELLYATFGLPACSAESALRSLDVVIAAKAFGGELDRRRISEDCLHSLSDCPARNYLGGRVDQHLHSSVPISSWRCSVCASKPRGRLTISQNPTGAGY